MEASRTQNVLVRNIHPVMHSRAGIFFKGNEKKDIKDDIFRELIVDPLMDEALSITDAKERQEALESLDYAHGYVGTKIGIGQLRMLSNDHALSISLPSEAIDVIERVTKNITGEQSQESAGPGQEAPAAKPLTLAEKFSKDPASLSTAELKKLAEEKGIILKSVKKDKIVAQMLKELK